MTAIIPRAKSAPERFDPDAFALFMELDRYLNSHDMAPEDSADARYDAVSACIDWLTNEELAEGVAWAKKRSATASLIAKATAR